MIKEFWRIIDQQKQDVINSIQNTLSFKLTAEMIDEIPLVPNYKNIQESIVGERDFVSALSTDYFHARNSVIRTKPL